MSTNRSLPGRPQPKPIRLADAEQEYFDEKNDEQSESRNENSDTGEPPLQSLRIKLILTLSLWGRLIDQLHRQIRNNKAQSNQQNVYEHDQTISERGYVPKPYTLFMD